MKPLPKCCLSSVRLRNAEGAFPGHVVADVVPLSLLQADIALGNGVCIVAILTAGSGCPFQAALGSIVILVAAVLDDGTGVILRQIIHFFRIKMCAVVYTKITGRDDIRIAEPNDLQLDIHPMYLLFEAPCAGS